MRKKPDQSYEDWIGSVQKEELHRAKDELGKGVPLEVVLETLANRIFVKAIHPLYKEQKKLYQDLYKKK